jgi:hypothetical protein
MSPEVKHTLELAPGDRLRLPGGVVRTVMDVRDSEWVNYRNQPIFYVLYVEGRTEEWSEGNSGIAATQWELKA